MNIIISNSNFKPIYEQIGVLKCSQSDFERLNKAAVKGFAKSSFGVEALVLRSQIKEHFLDAHVIDTPTIDDIMLHYVKEEK